jgi:hypothetical protein
VDKYLAQENSSPGERIKQPTYVIVSALIAVYYSCSIVLSGIVISVKYRDDRACPNDGELTWQLSRDLRIIDLHHR